MSLTTGIWLAPAEQNACATKLTQSRNHLIVLGFSLAPISIFVSYQPQHMKHFCFHVFHIQKG